MTNGKPAHTLAFQRRIVAKEAHRVEQGVLLGAHQPLARIAFLALIGILLYLSTVAYNTSHLDLLLNTKVGVIWSLVELPRRWVLGVGSLVLAVIHYEAISLHNRVDRQFKAWHAALPIDETKRHRHLLWLHGGLISDHYSSPIFGRLLPFLSKVIVYSVLWLAPVLTLTFIQAVVMPVHSEWLSSAVRISLVIVVLLVAYNAMQRHANYENLKIKWKKIRLDRCVAGVICSVGMYLSLHVFLWPGESLQRIQTALMPSDMVWDPALDSTNTYRYFLGFKCGISDNSEWEYQDVDTYEYGNNGWYKREPFSTSKPQSVRADYGNNISFFVPPTVGWQCPDRDYKTVISTQLLRAWISHQSKRFSPNYELSKVIVNGSNLTVEERDNLARHTADQPLHPKFDAILKQLSTLDLSLEDLRFATFCNAWLPKVKLPTADKLEGTNFCGAMMQGVELSGWKEKSALSEPNQWSLLTGIDLSGGSLYSGEFEDLTLGFTAIAARIDGLILKRVAIQNADWRFSTLANPLFLQSDSKRRSLKNSITHSKFDGASMEAPQFHATEILQSSFVGVELSNPLFFKGTKIQGSDFSLANLAGPAGVYEGTNLVTWKDSKLNFAQFKVGDRSKHIFDKSINGASDAETLIFETLRNMQRNNPIGPLWISKEMVLNTDRISLNNSTENYWLIQQQWRANIESSGEVPINEEYYRNVLQRCESSNTITTCVGFSPALQSLAVGTMRDLCAKYAPYISSDLANTLYTAASASNPKELLDKSLVQSVEQRKKFMACLKNKYGAPRAASL